MLLRVELIRRRLRSGYHGLFLSTIREVFKSRAVYREMSTRRTFPVGKSSPPPRLSIVPDRLNTAEDSSLVRIEIIQFLRDFPISPGVDPRPRRRRFFLVAFAAYQSNRVEVVDVASSKTTKTNRPPFAGNETLSVTFTCSSAGAVVRPTYFTAPVHNLFGFCCVG